MTNEEAIKLLTQYIDYDAETPDYYKMEEACKMAIKALEQEPKFILKSDGTIEQIKNYDVLDKIRAEIESNRNEWIKGEDAEWHIYDRCLLIIDKYTAESEDEE